MACNPVGFFGSCCAPPPDPNYVIYGFRHFVAVVDDYTYSVPSVTLASLDGQTPWDGTAADAWNSVPLGGGLTTQWTTVVTDLGTLDDTMKSTANWSTNGVKTTPRYVPGGGLYGTSSYSPPYPILPYIEDPVDAGSWWGHPVYTIGTFHDLAGPTVTAGRYAAQLQEVNRQFNPSLIRKISTFAGVASYVIIWTWPATPTNTLSGEHGIYRVKFTYKTFTDLNFTTTTPIGTYCDGFSLGPTDPYTGLAMMDASSTDTYTLATNAFDVHYGGAVDTAGALNEIINGTSTKDGFIQPDPTTTNTSQTTTKLTVAAASAVAGDTIYYIAVAANPVRYTANPFVAYPGKGSQTAFFVEKIAGNVHMFTVTGLEVQDNFGAAIESYNY